VKVNVLEVEEEVEAHHAVNSQAGQPRHDSGLEIREALAFGCEARQTISAYSNVSWQYAGGEERISCARADHCSGQATVDSHRKYVTVVDNQAEDE